MNIKKQAQKWPVGEMLSTVPINIRLASSMWQAPSWVRGRVRVSQNLNNIWNVVSNLGFMN